MKKICFILSVIIMLLAISSCKPNESQNDNELSTQSNVHNTIENISFNNNQYETNQEKTPSKSDVQSDFYLKFKTSVDNNQYDAWLTTELSKGQRPEKVIYAEYLASWKSEFSFTIETGKHILEYEDYISWKNELEQWLVSTQDILKIEMNLMEATLPQLEVIIPHCKLIRQKVIDMKKFLYYYEDQKLGKLDINTINISIKWAYD